MVIWVINTNFVGLAGLAIVCEGNLDETNISGEQMHQLRVSEVFTHYLVHDDFFLSFANHLDFAERLVLFPVRLRGVIQRVSKLSLGLLLSIVQSESLQSVYSEFFIQIRVILHCI